MEPDPHPYGAGTAGYQPAGIRDDIAAQVAHGRGERTRNGLLKRVPRPRRPVGPERPEPSTPDVHPDQAATELRSRLTSLRAGMARGEQDHVAGGASYPAGDPSSRSEYGSEAERSTHAR